MQRIQEARLWLQGKISQGIALAKEHKRKTAAGFLVLSMFVTGTSLANHYYNTNSTTLYHVYVDGQVIGTVDNPDIIKRYIDKKIAEQKSAHPSTEIVLLNQIKFEEETKYKGTATTDQTLEHLKNKLQIKAKAQELLINGEAVGYAADEETIERVLEELKSQYGPAVSSDKAKTVQAASVDQQHTSDVKVQFKEDVKWNETLVPADKLISSEQLKTLLAEGTLERVVHTVEEGDCISCIASKYNITTKDIYRQNPGIDENTLLQIGQEIVVTALQPKLTVQTIEKKTIEQTIDYPIEVIPTETMYRGESKVIQKGSEGLKKVTYEIVKENGVEVAKKILQEETIKEPVKEKVQRGTKVKPNRGDGRFLWPTNGGRITSGYGTRWGRLHAGIDIAGSANRTIKAADNGKVIAAGWNGNYGKCIIIDHGNGYKTLYGHLSSISVSVGDTVLKGQKIGVMGSTGHSTGTHLHFEIMRGNSKINPLKLLRG